MNDNAIVASVEVMTAPLHFWRARFLFHYGGTYAIPSSCVVCFGVDRSVHSHQLRALTYTYFADPNADSANRNTYATHLYAGATDCHPQAQSQCTNGDKFGTKHRHDDAD